MRYSGEIDNFILSIMNATVENHSEEENEEKSELSRINT